MLESQPLWLEPRVLDLTEWDMWRHMFMYQHDYSHFNMYICKTVRWLVSLPLITALTSTRALLVFMRGCNCCSKIFTKSNTVVTCRSYSVVLLSLQKLLLDDLYKTKHCNMLLVPKADEDMRWVQDKAPPSGTRRRRQTTVNSGLLFFLFQTLCGSVENLLPCDIRFML